MSRANEVPPATAGDVQALVGDARALGLDAEVAAEGTLAVIRLHVPGATGDAPLLDAERRQALVAAARRRGFTHVALELTDATLRGAGVAR